MFNMKISNMSFKVGTILFLLIIFLLPIGLIKNLIMDRQMYEKEAETSVVEPIGGSPNFQGLFLAIPYTYSVNSFDENQNKIIKKETNYIIFSPKNYNLDVNVSPYNLKRGIFKIPVFNANMKLEASFDKLDFSNFNINDQDIDKKKSLLIFGVSNKRIFAGQPQIEVNGVKPDLIDSEFDFSKISKETIFYNLKGINIDEGLNINMDINFHGGNDIIMRPIAEDNQIKMTSTWNSPSFSGDFLPIERNVNKKGFTSTWSVSRISTSYPRSFIYGNDFPHENITTGFVLPINNYTKTVRSIKYAILFLMIPFFALLFLEVISGIKIHPIQYMLIGISNIIFYLLLISISEHLNFNLSYLICCICVLTISCMYISAIFKTIKKGLTISLIQLMSYVFLFGTLQSEDYALLIGSVGVFLVVALFMFVTRKIDWYKIGDR